MIILDRKAIKEAEGVELAGMNISEIRYSNILLIDALADMVNQFGYRVGKENKYFYEGGLSTFENALPLLKNYGYAKTIYKKKQWYKINFKAISKELEKRKKEWEISLRNKND